MDKVYMTPEGFKAMEDELKNLKFVERPKIVAAIEEARALGDLSEMLSITMRKTNRDLTKDVFASWNRNCRAQK